MTVSEWWKAVEEFEKNQDDSGDPSVLEEGILEYLQTAPLTEALSWVRNAILECPKDRDWGVLVPLVEHVACEDGVVAVFDEHPLFLRYSLMELLLSGHKEFAPWNAGELSILPALEVRDIEV